MSLGEEKLRNSDFCSSQLTLFGGCDSPQYFLLPWFLFFWYNWAAVFSINKLQSHRQVLLNLLPNWHWEKKSCNKIYNELTTNDSPIYCTRLECLHSLGLEGYCLGRDFHSRPENLKAWFKVASTGEKENNPFCVGSVVKWNYKYHFMKTESSNMFWCKRWLSLWNPKAPQLFIWMDGAGVGCFLEGNAALRKLGI